MARTGLAHKLSRHLHVSGKVADKLVKAGYQGPKAIKAASKHALRKNVGLTQSEVNAVKARWV